MKIEAVVKVMNFHSLLRVDSSRKRAERYGEMEKELASMMKIIMNNRNLKLDKLIRMPDPSLPVLRIYLGSDFGFCGNVNTSVQALRNAEYNTESIVIGKKLRKTGAETLYLLHDEFGEVLPKLKEYVEGAVRESRWSAVELVYNHYYNSGTIRTEVRRIYPLEMEKGSEEEADANADYMIEGDPKDLLEGLMITYLMYEIKIAESSSYASENLMRQNSTSESLKKIREMKEEEAKVERRERNMASFRKTVDSYIKQKSLERS